MRGKKVLVTGATGFIGAALTKKLVEFGNNTSVFLRSSSDKKRLTSILDDVAMYETDLADADRVAKYLLQIKPEIIFHLAGSGVYSYFDTSIGAYNDMIESNVQGTLNLLVASQKSACSLFINTGSCYEYGSSTKPFKETSILTPVNVYGSTKAATTLIANAFFKNNCQPVVTIRPFTVYGPEEDPRRFISTVIRKCLNKENSQLTKKTIVRDYIFIDDVVDGYIRTATVGKKIAGEVINISTGIATSLQDASKIILRLTGVNATIDIGGYPARLGEVESLVGDAKKAQKMLSWKAKYTLEEGLQKTIDWIKKT